MKKKAVVKVLAVALGMLLSSSNVSAAPCQADNNCDGKVDLTDLVKMKEQFLKNDCDPVCSTPVFRGVPKTGQTILTEQQLTILPD